MSGQFNISAYVDVGVEPLEQLLLGILADAYADPLLDEIIVFKRG